MRLLCELFLVALLIWLGWEKSFHGWINQLRGIPPPAQSVQTTTTVQAPPRQPAAPVYRPRPQPTSTRGGDWMWDPTHRGPLDRPAYDSRDRSQQDRDASGRNYWIDGQGVRHPYAASAAPPPASPSP